jgi:carbon storage regulator
MPRRGRRDTNDISVGSQPDETKGAVQMLVLSRQRDESIIIGDNIIITVVDIRGDKVRLGIQAPTEIPVHRQEVYEAIQRENLKSRGIDPDDAAHAIKPLIPRKGTKPGG